MVSPRLLDHFSVARESRWSLIKCAMLLLLPRAHARRGKVIVVVVAVVIVVVVVVIFTKSPDIESC